MKLAELANIDYDSHLTTTAQRLFSVANYNQAGVAIVVIRQLK